MEKEVVDFDFQSQLLEERKDKIIERSNKMRYDEEFHTKGRAEWSVNLFLELDKFITSLKTGIRKEYLETYIKYSYNGLLFCYIMLRKKETVRVWAKIGYDKLEAVPLFVRDYEPTSRRFGVMITFDDMREFLQNKEAMLDVVFGIIKKALQVVAGRKKRKETPLTKKIVRREGGIPKNFEQVEKKIEIIKSSEINISAGENGYLSINLKIHKSQKGILNKILQETILKE